MNTFWLIRIAFASTFIGHGAGKIVMPMISAQMLELPLALTVLVGVAEVLAGLGAIVGGISKAPYHDLVDRLAGLAATPVLLGAIAMVHWPRWSFVPTDTHPMGGMEFQLLLLSVALYLLFGRAQKAG